jgi:hypothetical protein
LNLHAHVVSNSRASRSASRNQFTFGIETTVDAGCTLLFTSNFPFTSIGGGVMSAQILSNARKLLEQVGWTQHTERDGQDRARLVGALLAAGKAANVFTSNGGLDEPLCLLRWVIANGKGEHWTRDPGHA